MSRTPLRDTSASSFLRSAWGHAKASQTLYYIWQEGGSKDATFFAFQNVLGFAIELYLKAFLRGQGWTVDDLASRSYAHKLDKLLSAAKGAGIFAYEGTGHVDPSALEKVISIIGPRFADFSFRYLDDQDDQYEYVQQGHFLGPILDDLQLRIERSGVRA